MYKKRIAELEKEYRSLDEQIKKEPSGQLLEKRSQLLEQLSTLRRRQYEYENEYVEGDDDR